MMKLFHGTVIVAAAAVSVGTAAADDGWGNDCPRQLGPEWARVLKREEVLPSMIMTALYDLRRFQAVIAADDCPCGLYMPTYEAAEAEMRERTKGLTDNQLFTLSEAVEAELSPIKDQARQMCRIINRPR